MIAIVSTSKICLVVSYITAHAQKSFYDISCLVQQLVILCKNVKKNILLILKTAKFILTLLTKLPSYLFTHRATVLSHMQLQ